MSAKSNKAIKQDESQNSKQTVNTSRRSFSKAGIAAPVIMTLASQRVFGVQCMSNRMSGNLSQPGGFSCWGGMSPGFWATPNGKPQLSTQKGEDWAWAWQRTGYTYGTAKPSVTHPNQWNDYTGGTCLITISTGAINPDFSFMQEVASIPHSYDADNDGCVSIREALNGGNNSNGLHTLLAGWLNVKYFASFNNPSDDYFIRDTADFINLYNTNKGLLLTLLTSYFDLTPSNQV